MSAATHTTKSGRLCRIVRTGPHDYGVIEYADGTISNYPPSRLTPKEICADPLTARAKCD